MIEPWLIGLLSDVDSSIFEFLSITVERNTVCDNRSFALFFGCHETIAQQWQHIKEALYLPHRKDVQAVSKVNFPTFPPPLNVMMFLTFVA